MWTQWPPTLPGTQAVTLNMSSPNQISSTEIHHKICFFLSLQGHKILQPRPAVFHHCLARCNVHPKQAVLSCLIYTRKKDGTNLLVMAWQKQRLHAILGFGILCDVKLIQIIDHLNTSPLTGLQSLLASTRHGGSVQDGLQQTRPWWTSPGGWQSWRSIRYLGELVG